MKIAIFIIAIILSVSVQAQQISVDNGYMVISGTIRIGGGLRLNYAGTLNSKVGSTIVFEGAGIQNISGTGNGGFENLTLDNSSNGVRLQREISVTGDITMTDGDLDLLNNNINLGQNGDIVGENSNSMIKSTSGNGNYTQGADAGNGAIIRSLDISTAGITNAAGLGINITPNTNWGSCNISRKHQRIVGFDGDNSVFRTYKISPTNSANLSANISIKYNPMELNGNNSGSLKMYQLKDNGAKGTEWEELNSSDNGSEVSATTNDNNLTEVTVALAGTNKTLPVSLLNFEAVCDGDIVLLQWKTASEINNNYFIIEKSIDDFQYEEIARIAGSGNSNNLKQYEIIDNNNEAPITYYRLKQVDFDGISKTYDPIVSECGAQKLQINFSVVNPAIEKLQIFVNESLNTNIIIRIYDAEGREVINSQLASNQQQWQIPIAMLSKGMYYIQFIGYNFTQSKSILILNN